MRADRCAARPPGRAAIVFTPWIRKVRACLRFPDAAALLLDILLEPH